MAKLGVCIQYHQNCQDFTDNAGDVELCRMQLCKNTRNS